MTQRFTRRTVLTAVAASLGAPALAAGQGGAPGPFTFPSIDGGTLSLADWAGRPVLVVNTASRCAFTPQYDALQAVYDEFRAEGLVVLAVPSDDFRQELGSAAEVREFCEVNFGLDLPMTDILHVRGRRAHPFYAWMAAEHGFEPAWNFNKILLDGEGRPVATYGARTRPDAPELTRRIEALLAAS